MHDVDSGSGCWIAAVLPPPAPPSPPLPLLLMELKMEEGNFLPDPPWRSFACKRFGGNLSEGRMYKHRDVVESVAHTDDAKWLQVL